MEYKINDSKVIFVGRKLNYYKEMIYYFRFLDESYDQLEKSHRYFKNPLFKNDNNEMFKDKEKRNEGFCILANKMNISKDCLVQRV